ncbi:MAG: HTH-type transcriptional regulator MurR [Firmicutes bacterium ADurb.Bin193]|nr:MAG: HTH-type transcriptional regulator MurR [Firmicutes bacterium ADurb.Bin193]
MDKHSDLLKRINSLYDTFSKGQKKIANYLVTNYDKAAFMTASQLSETIDTSCSTVVRFAVELGYDGYPMLQRALQELVRTNLTALQRIEMTSTRVGQQNLLATILNFDIMKIKQTLEEIDYDAFETAVEATMKAEKIYIVGVRSSSALATFLGFYMNLIFDNIKLIHTTSASEIFEQILRVNEKDVVIGISFPRYSARTVKALRYAKNQGAKIITITDSETSPLTPLATHALIARTDIASFADSLVAPLSVINAFIAALGMRRKESIYKTFDQLEAIWSEYQVYETMSEKDDNKG